MRLAAALAALLVWSCLAVGCDDGGTCTPAGEIEGEAPGVQNGTCAPEGELFTDHYSCEGVGGPCPSTDERGASAKVPADAAREGDPDLDWAAGQIASCSCSCCHHNGGLSAHIYSWDFTPVWTDSLDTERLDKLISPDVENDIAPEKNNGFSRLSTDIPSTDGARLKAFFQRERERRR